MDRLQVRDLEMRSSDEQRQSADPRPPALFEGDLAAQKLSGAILSPCGRYRYKLWRQWDRRPTVAFVGLNPSTADATKDDATLRRCIGFAKRWGHGSLVMLNLFGLRSTDPDALLGAADRVGPDTDTHLLREAQQAHRVVVCWGQHRATQGRSLQVATVLQRMGVRLWCLGTTADGSPRHPLRLRADTPLARWLVPMARSKSV